MLLSEGVKRYASSSFESDNVLRLRCNKTFHLAYPLFWQACLCGWIAIEQLCAADMYFAHAADIDRYTAKYDVAGYCRNRIRCYEATAEVAAAVIGGCYGFEYYMVSKHQRWLICENHHNRVI